MNTRRIALLAAVVMVASAVILILPSDESEGATTIESEGLRYSLNPNLTTTVTDVVTDKDEFVIPTSVTYGGNSYRVTEIGSFAFSQSKMNTVTIPSTITEISERAFNSCVNLETVYFNATNCNNLNDYNDYVFENAGTSTDGMRIIFSNGVTRIPDNLFYVGYNHTDPNLKSVVLSGSIKTIGEKAFYEMELTSVVFPEGIETIESSAFTGCSLEDITLPEGLETISDFAFHDNPAKKIVIPSTVTAIGKDAFSDCREVTELQFNSDYSGGFNIYSDYFKGIGADGPGVKLTFGEGVTKIPANMFYNDIVSSGIQFNIISVTFPSTVTSIGQRAFACCDYLREIIFDCEEVPAIGDKAFTIGKSNSTATCYVYSELPDGFLDDDNISNDYTFFVYNLNPNYHTISFNANGGSGTHDSFRVKGGSDVRLPSSTDFIAPDGKTFAGWSLTLGGEIVTTVENVEDDYTVYAVWKNIIYSLSFDLNGGSGSVNTQYHDAGSAVTLPQYDGTLKGHVFVGWKIGNDLLKPGESFIIDSDTVATAVWVTEEQGHLHDMTYVPEKDATCTDDGNIEYWTCSVCEKKFSDANGNTEIMNVIIPTEGHMWQAWMTAQNHGRTCLKCGTEYSEPHHGGTATCESQAVCEVCKQPYGDLAPHVLTHVSSKEATCTDSGTLEHWECSVCGRMFSDASGTNEITDVSIPADGHTVSDTWEHDPDRHWKVCTMCGETLEKGDHSGGTATCRSEAVCEVCGTEYGGLGDHDLTEIREVEATCTEDGVAHHWKCSVCNRTFSDASGKTETLTTVIPALGHSFTGEIKSDGNGHWHICVRCGEAGTPEEHSGGTATCVSGAVCEVCGSMYDEPDLKNHTGGTTVTGVVQPTETKPGYSGDLVCNGCRTILVQGQEVPPLKSEQIYHRITYIVDGEVYRTEEVRDGSIVLPLDDPALPEKEGYDRQFIRWEGYEQGMVARTDLTFKAEIEDTLKVCTVVYTVLDSVIRIDELNYGDTIEPPTDFEIIEDEAFVYTFVGWKGYEPGMKATEDRLVLEAIVETTDRTYTVTFTVDGYVFEEYEVGYGNAVPLPDDPEKDGYVFDRWDGYDPDMKVHRNLTFEAVFVAETPEPDPEPKPEPETHTIRFIVDGEVYHEVTLEHGERIVAPSDPYKPSDGENSYRFDRWDGYVAGMTATQNMDFTAVFNADPIVVVTPKEPDEPDDNTTIYIATVVIVVIVVAGIGVFLHRRP